MKNKLIVSATLILLIMAVSVNLSYAMGEEIQQQRQVMPAGIPYQDVPAVDAQQKYMDARNADKLGGSGTAQAVPGTNSNNGGSPAANNTSNTANTPVQVALCSIPQPVQPRPVPTPPMDPPPLPAVLPILMPPPEPPHTDINIGGIRITIYPHPEDYHIFINLPDIPHLPCIPPIELTVPRPH